MEKLADIEHDLKRARDEITQSRNQIKSTKEAAENNFQVLLLQNAAQEKQIKKNENITAALQLKKCQLIHLLLHSPKPQFEKHVAIQARARFFP